MREAELLEKVRALAKTLNVAVYHTHRSDRSEPGFPDLCLVGERVMFRELKSATGKATAAQVWWLQILAESGVDAGLWRPEDWPERILAEMHALGRCPIPPPQPSQAELRRKLSRRQRPLTR